MSNINLLWNSYRYLPYERELAKKEVIALCNATPRVGEKGLEIPKDGLALQVFDRLTYFSAVTFPDGSIRTPDQARLETAYWRKKAGSNEKRCIKRQSTRYSAHGLHEYRGKFNPQIVRAVGNIIRLPVGAWVLDPFCGSGTTLLECAHVGWNGLGIDLNPLGIAITKAKIKAIHTPVSQLRGAAEALSQSLLGATIDTDYERSWSKREIEKVAGAGWADTLPNVDYLESWFKPPVLAQFAAILQHIDEKVDQNLTSIFKVILSDVVREASLQEPADLRIRRRKNPTPNYPVIPSFLTTMANKLTNVYTTLEEITPDDFSQRAILADSRLPFRSAMRSSGGLDYCEFDCAITSPPYATALPYIDTQRLSLCLLGLLESGEIAKVDRSMVGTRELTERNRKDIETKIRETDENGLPQSVLNLCSKMLRLAALPDNGFRRRNMPALIHTYFTDMAQVMGNVQSVLKPGGIFALVIGRNKTVLGNESVIIDTPQLLVDTALKGGWDIQEIIELDTYQRYDMHQRNSIRTEQLVLLRKPQSKGHSQTDDVAVSQSDT
ncbi:MAG: DNA methyltransferase [Dehalococcoidia bacterium]|jgi:site-specific DNA-methyltransferase (cytosine-N4-specific)